MKFWKIYFSTLRKQAKFMECYNLFLFFLAQISMGKLKWVKIKIYVRNPNNFMLLCCVSFFSYQFNNLVCGIYMVYIYNSGHETKKCHIEVNNKMLGKWTQKKQKSKEFYIMKNFIILLDNIYRKITNTVDSSVLKLVFIKQEFEFKSCKYRENRHWENITSS